MKPILVCVHLFYPEMWPELKKCVLNVANYPFELYVTMVKHDLDAEDDILQTFPKAHIQIVENRGYDLGPFMEVLNQVNIEKYSYVVKLHTKRDVRLGTYFGAFNVSGSKWRQYLLNFCATKENFEKTIQAFEQNPRLGMAADFRFLSIKKKTDIVGHRQALALLQKLNLETKSSVFVGGTMFICRAKLLKPLQKLGLKISDFETSSAHVHGGQLAHALERLLGYVVTAQGFVIQDVRPKFQVELLKILCQIKKTIFHKRKNRQGYFVYKILRIPVLKIPSKDKD